MSLSSKTKVRRRLRKAKMGVDRKKQNLKKGTPAFPLDPAKAGPNSAEKLNAKG